jgi:outer membrane protein
MLKTILFTAAGTLLLGAHTAMGQFGLGDIYALAQENDPVVREAEANYLAAIEAKPQARSALLPDVSLSGDNSGSYSESTAGIGFAGFELGSSSQSRSSNYGLDVAISQPLLDLVALRSLRQSDKIVAQAELNYALAQQDLIVRVAAAYFDVLAAEELLAAETASLEAIARQLEQAQRRFDVGLIAITDVQQSQAAYDNAVATQISAEQNLATMQYFLTEIIGEYVTNLRGPTDEFPMSPPNPNSADDWVSAAMEQNLALAISRIGIDIAQDDVQILRAQRLPTLTLSAGLGTNSFDQLAKTFDENGDLAGQPRPRFGDTDSRNWSINLRVPLYTGGFNSSRIQQAVYRQRASRESLERVARETERQTRDAYLGVITGISRVEALQQAVQSNQTALRATEAGFEVGTQTTVDVLAAQDALRRAQTNYAISRYDYIINVLALWRAAGTLSEADISRVDEWLEQQQ